MPIGMMPARARRALLSWAAEMEPGARMATKREANVVYGAGLVKGIVLVTFPAASTIFTDDQSLAYGLLLAVAACLGVGFGLTAPALNTFTAVFHPAAVDRSVLVPNALPG